MLSRTSIKARVFLLTVTAGLVTWAVLDAVLATDAGRGIGGYVAAAFVASFILLMYLLTAGFPGGVPEPAEGIPAGLPPGDSPDVAPGPACVNANAHEAKLMERELYLLQRAMEILGVGLVACKDHLPAAANTVMSRYSAQCGGMDAFIPVVDSEYAETELADLDGRKRYFTSTRFHSPDEGKEYLLVQDVTQSRLAADALRDSEARARAVTDTATDAIILIDHNGCITYWNPMAARMFGYTSEEVMGKDVHDMLTPPKFMEAARKGLKNYLETGEGPAIGITRMLSALKKDGTEFPIELSLSSFRSGGKLNSVGLIRDISERVNAEADKNAMFHMITHDIKGPLSIIFGYSEILEQQCSGANDESEMVREIQKATSRIAALIDDMLALSRLESRTVKPVFEPVEMRELITSSALDCMMQARDMGVTVDLDIHDEPLELVADRKQMMRAIGNLAVNAVKYNRAGGRVLIQAGVAAWADGRPQKVFIEVSDTGVGIPEEDLTRVFDKYFRSSTSSGRRGTGLGLAIVKASVDAHCGSVSVKSTVGKGSTFRVELPINPTEYPSEQ